MSRNKIEYSFIEAWKPVFNNYPTLEVLPVYAWGRYYKYESAGEPFEYIIDDRGFSGFPDLDHDSLLDRDLLSKIDEEHNQPGGNIWTCKWGDFTPTRKQMVKSYGFDDRFAKAVIIVKSDDGELAVEIVDSDTNE